MAKHDAKARPEAREAKPLHHHALRKASAEHLYRNGDIDEAKRHEIVSHAERAMRKLRKSK